MSDGCRGAGGGGGGGGRGGRRGGRVDRQASTTISLETGRGLGDDAGSLATTFHELEQDLRREESNVNLLQQQIIYDKYLSAVPFVQERENSLSAFQNHDYASSGANPASYHSIVNGVGDQALAGGTGTTAAAPTSSLFVNGETDVMNHRSIHWIFEERLQSRLPDERASKVATDLVRRSQSGLSNHSTFIAASDSPESAVTSSQPLQAVTDPLLLSTSPAAMVQQDPGMPRNSSSHNIAPSISRSASLDLDTGASLATVAFHCEPQVAVRNEGAVQSKANGDAMKSSEILGLKKARGADHTREFLVHQVRKKQQRSESARWRRPTDQAEHIVRERQRRDNMTSRFSTLETLLPPGPKRDRSTIVDESIQYVKNLHHQISALRQRRSNLKLTLESSSCLTTGERTAASTIILTTRKGNPCSIDRTTTTTPDEMPFSKRPRQNDDTAPMMAMLEEGSHSPEKQQSNSDVAATGKNRSADKVYVFMDLPEQVVIEMVCQPRPHIQSQLLQAVESLGLDVCQCSLNKIVLRVVYVIVAKPRVVTSNAVSYDDIMEALKSALGPDIIPKTKPGTAISY